MSSNALLPFHQSDRCDNTDDKSGATAKRGPEADVQFVSAHPVKKLRSSRGSSFPQSQPICGPIGIVGQDHLPTEALLSIPPPNRLAEVSPTREPQPEADMLGQGVSMPSMDNYVFPPPLNSLPSATSNDSPALSPKQLPQPPLPQPTQPTGSATSRVSTAPAFENAAQPRNFHVPWGLASLYPQPTPTSMHTALTLHRPLLLPPVQAQRAEASSSVQNKEEHHFEQSRTPMAGQGQSQVGSLMHQRLEPEPNPLQSEAAQPEKQNEASVSQFRASPETRAQPKPETKTSSRHPSLQTQEPMASAAPASTTRPQQCHPPESRHPTPAPLSAQPPAPSSMSMASGNTMAGSQRAATKTPCLICEQMRQQALFNQVNGYPISYLHRMQHGWTGAGQGSQQLHMQHAPQIDAGFGMAQQLPDSSPARHQPAGPGPLPLGFLLPQMPFQVPMQIQRPAQGAATPTSATGPKNEVSLTTKQASPAPMAHFTLRTSQHMLPRHAESRNLTQQPMMAPETAASLHSSPPLPASHVPAQTSHVPSQQRESPRVSSPNLIVDIAETCEAVFPWDEVAKRHGVPQQRVVETFSAIIQLPLLRCATDMKCHGKLATNRPREYTKARKDAEAVRVATGTSLPIDISLPATTAGPLIVGSISETNTSHGQPLLPGVVEMASTMAPLGLPSNLTIGTGRPWQR